MYRLPGDPYHGGRVDERGERALTLRRRLTLLVALTIVVPIMAVGVTVVNLLGGQVEQRAFERLQQAGGFGRARLTDDAMEVGRLVQVMAADPRLDPAGTPDDLERSLEQALDKTNLDFLVVEGDGGVAGSARREPQFEGGVAVPTDADLLRGGPNRRVLLGTGALASGAQLVGGRWIDNARLRQIARPEDVELTLVEGAKVVASTAAMPRLPAIPLDGTFSADFGGEKRLAHASRIPSIGLNLLAWSRPPAESRTNLIVGLGLLLLVLTILIAMVGQVVSGLVTRPVEDLRNAAEAVAQGDLTQRVDVSGDVEVAKLGEAFNRMTDNLRAHVTELEQSRNEFQAAIARLGDVLVSTHDIGGIIDVVLEACTLTMRADEALFFERVAMPARIRASAAQSWAVPDLELNATGVAGAAARLLVPVTWPGDAELDPREPQVEAAIAVPVVNDNRLFGVLAVYGKQGGGPFNASDVHTLQTLARQAEVAIGNVFLHDETRRQARTDGTTGLWNRREFELRSRDSVREAQRFEEHVGFILVDIDNFKQVNDKFDHSTGDAALIWLASRLSEATREIDVVARWGGEEFIVLLPRAGPEETAAVAERVRETIAREPMVDGSKVIPLTVSIGMACHPDDGTTADALFRAADAALLRAKRLGKNRVERARPEEGAA